VDITKKKEVINVVPNSILVGACPNYFHRL